MREKLFVIDEWTDSKWEPRYLQRSKFRWVLNKAQSLIGLCSRVRRVKTPAKSVVVRAHSERDARVMAFILKGTFQMMPL